jgi:ribosomal protein S12 methylthiotransferase
MYFYPMYIDDALIDTLTSSRHIIPYLDMPLQHINDTMLKRMARRVTRAETEALLDKLRHRIPDLVLRTTFITGFPGETDEQFAELVEFVQRQRFERTGVFVYSLESDTPAAALPDRVGADVAQARRDRLMQVQQEIAFDWNQQQVGRHWDVILDAPVPGERDVWIGRSPADAPDVDGLVYVTGKRLRAGQIVACEIVATHDYDLVAAVSPRPARV